MKACRTAREKLNRNKSLMVRYKRQLYRDQEGFCADCGAFFPEEALEVHHIVGVSEAPHLVNKKYNMVLLCPDCHKRRHGQESSKG